MAAGESGGISLLKQVEKNSLSRLAFSELDSAVTTNINVSENGHKTVQKMISEKYLKAPQKSAKKKL